MNLKINGIQSFGGSIPGGKSASIMIADNAKGIIYKILPQRPQYMYASHKKIIQYPVNVNGVDTVYNVRYPYPQNHINRIGGELMDKEGIDLQLLSAREIAKDIAGKTLAIV